MSDHNIIQSTSHIRSNMFSNHHPMPGISYFPAQDSDPGVTCEGHTSYRRNGLQIEKKNLVNSSHRENVRQFGHFVVVKI